MCKYSGNGCEEKPIMAKIAFCLISHTAHVRHLVPVAIAYAELTNDRVDILISSEAVLVEFNQVVNELSSSNFNVIFLKGGWFKTLIGKLKGRHYPNIKNVINNNKKRFLAYDCLVTPHHNLDRVMELDHLNKIKYVCTFHGAGDGEIGFDKRFSFYDLLLVSGQDIKNRLCDAGIVHKSNQVELVGYPKLEMLTKRVPEDLGFDVSTPVVLYNPHYAKSLTSWYQDGIEILEWFSKHPDYNLIFAPHVKLFYGPVPAEVMSYADYNNIIIDCGGSRSTDATYSQVADIYIGDVSSQVYESLYFSPKPLIFINSHGVQWQGDPNYKMWQLGQVVNDIAELEDKLDNIKNNRFLYSKEQILAIESKFSKFDVGAANTSANQIHQFLHS